MSFSVVSRMLLPRATPALLIRTVGLPSVERTEDAADLIESGEERSQWKYRTEGGAGKRQYRCLVVRARRYLTLVCEVLYIKHGDLDVSLSKKVHHNLANAIAATSHNDDLLTPHICVIAPVIRHGSVKPGTDASEYRKTS